MSIGLQKQPRPAGSGQGFEARILLIPAVLWLGVLIGASFLATQVKIQAPSLDLPTALEVGRVTFALLTRVEWGLWALVAFAAALSRTRAGGWTLVIVLAVILMVQSVWLLPVLDERIGRIIAGEAPPPSAHHLIYVIAEGLKALGLILLSAVAFRSGSPGARA